MKKRFAIFLAAIILIVGVSAGFYAFANQVSWDYDSSSKTLTIYGSGDMDDYDDQYAMPWYRYIKQIETVVIEDGVTSVGANSLSGASNLNDVKLADSVTTINDSAFSSCSSLTEITLSESINNIADASIAYDGLEPKENFTINAKAGSYALYFAVKNKIAFNADSVKCGTYIADICSKGMYAYYPYDAKVNGTFKIYSTGGNDTYGYVYDENFSRLKSNDDASSTNTNFSITCDLEKGKRYYFAAKIYNTSIIDTFGFVIEPVTYSVSGSVYAMADPSGAKSDVLLDNATIDFVPTDNGRYTVDINSVKYLYVFECEGKTIRYWFNPDNGDTQDIVIPMCDVNSDGIVNGKDFASMLKSNSRYLPLFEAFADTKM